MLELICGILLFITVLGPILSGIGRLGATMVQCDHRKPSPEETAAQREWDRLGSKLAKAQKEEKAAGRKWPHYSAEAMAITNDYKKAYAAYRVFEENEELKKRAERFTR